MRGAAGGALALALLWGCGRERTTGEGVLEAIGPDRVTIRRDDVVGATRGIMIQVPVDDAALTAGAQVGARVRFAYTERALGLFRVLEELVPAAETARSHDHRPRHGGVVEMIDRLHVEAAAAGDGRVQLWLSDFWRQPLPVDRTTGRVSVTDGEHTAEAGLRPTADGLEARLERFTNDRIEVRAELRHDGRPVTARFVIPLSGRSRGVAGLMSRRCVSAAGSPDGRRRCVVRFTRAITGVAAATAGDVAVVLGGNGQLSAWRPSTGELLSGLLAPPPHDDDHHAATPLVAVSPNGAIAFVAADDQVARYDLRDGSYQRGVPLKGAQPQTLAASPTGGAVLVANRFGTSAWIYDFAQSRLLRTIPANREIGAAAFSDDGRRVAVGDDGGTVTVADLEGTGTRTFVGLGEGAQGVAIVGDRLVGLSRDGLLAVWDLDAGIARLRIPTALRNAHLAISAPDGLVAVAGGLDVRLYALSDGRLVDSITWPRGRIVGVALSGGSLLLTDAKGRMTLTPVAPPAAP